MKNRANIYVSVKDYLVSGEKFDLLLDENLGLLKTSPQPKVENLSKYYESDQYISHTDDKSGLFASLYQLVKKWSLKHKTKLIRNQNGSVGSLLDVGAGTGDFLKVAKDNGWKVNGTEPNTNALNLASKKGISLKANLNEFAGEQFDVVTLWHVLEHVADLDETIRTLANLVKPSGTLIIAVPNFKSYDAKYYGKYWAAYDAPRHLWHFSKHSIIKLFKTNFQLQKIKPMIFDSFYVSLLSEKYKAGNAFSVKAIWIGLLSNFKGMSTKEYSSHIYCFKRIK
ncbi:class I SAM-dependent methyltransferase [Aequorivita marisscotiae]|uniref:Class I SAM-dependent methyltransferase n=1 Tax=Aequorivita marisscotiae TaxID=3040348 RepID=A0ABY8KWD0_9FLAO|nr:class I SAM-dependent methyltransferase [Aequorivita sp. Ant34-E75]WGF93461.1 class I SAM-dependent methyltransferase [Aequorivita sp. Ant34-E75]